MSSSKPDIIEDILPRLPIKSLGRFKSVSKTWRSLISNPKFIKSHINKQSQQTPKVILLSDGYDSLYSIDLNELQQHLEDNKDIEDEIELPETAKEITLGSSRYNWHEVMGSCNGLVLVHCYGGNIYMLNPTTKELRKVPSNPFGIKWNVEHYQMYGFGYDPSTDDYKVVSISFREFKRGMVVDVYSLRKKSWRQLPNAPYRHSVDNVCPGVLFNQHLHWLTGRPKSSEVIVAFSLVDEKFNEIELPELSDDEDNVGFSELAVIGGKLAIFSAREVCYLWVLEEYGNSKSWMYLWIRDPGKFKSFVEGSSRDIVMSDEDKVVIYIIEEKRRFTERMGWDPEPNEFDVGGMYFETLESPANCIRRAR